MKKVQNPVYLVDIESMLLTNVKAEDPQAVDRIEIALSCAKELIRQKRNFGLERGE